MNKWDKILTCTILFVSLAAMAILEIFAFGSMGNTVEIYVDGALQASYNFRALREPITYVCDTEYGYNKIVIDSRGAYVEESDCADKTDIRKGRISETNASLICLPNRLVVQITGGQSDADIIAY